MEFLNSQKKYLGLSLITWIIIIIIIIFILYCKSCESFTNASNNVKKITVYNFNTEWCGYSRQFAPEFSKFKDRVESDPSLQNVNVVDFKMDDEKDPNVIEMAQKYRIEGFPTVIFEVDNIPILYRGVRKVDNLFSFLELQLKDAPVEDRKEIQIYNFHTTWCGFSRSFAPEFKKFEEHVKNNPKYKDVDAIDFLCDDTNDLNVIEKTEKYQIEGYPTVIFDIKGKFHTYEGPRTMDSIIAHLDKLL
tara:strand:- start:2444 stop:3184 length:741 start_codon:yes stop_codon:yes gene_type:complete